LNTKCSIKDIIHYDYHEMKCWEVIGVRCIVNQNVTVHVTREDSFTPVLGDHSAF